MRYKLEVYFPVALLTLWMLNFPVYAHNVTEDDAGYIQEIMKISVSKLSSHPLNSEIYSLSSLDDLISSIEEFGLLQPLVINQRNEVVSGNRRLEAIRRLGWEEVTET